MRSSITLLLLVLLGSFQSLAQTARVTVVAVDGFGNLLKGTDVYQAFDSESHDRTSLFHLNVGAAIPYGRYRISVQALGAYQEQTFDIDVQSKVVLIQAGLEWFGSENIPVTAPMRGNILDSQKVKEGACRASGVYLRNQFDSAVVPATMSFDFGRVPAGLYTLTCTTGSTILLSQIVKIQGDANDLELHASKPQ